MKLFKEVNDEGITVLVVTHEDDISKMTKRIIRLNDGVIGENVLVQNAVASAS